jgi:periplasmic protein TonB
MNAVIIRNIILALLLLITISCHSQNNYMPESTGNNKPSGQPPAGKNQETEFLCLETMPEFPGGDSALFDFLNSNLRYPENAIRKGQSGRVIVRFVVREDGRVDNASVLVSAYMDLDNELLRVVRMLPRFEPGKLGEKPIPVWYMVPGIFILEGETSPWNKVVVRPPEIQPERVKINIYPNPASDYIIIRTDTVTSDMEVSLVSSSGTIIMRDALTAEETQLKLQDVTPGLLFVIIKSPSINYKKSFKVVKREY